MTGPLYEVKDTVTLSDSARKLQQALENTMNLRLMAESGSRKIRVTIDPATRLIWRLEPLQESLRLHDVYQRFLDEALHDDPPRLRSALGRVALERLKTNSQDLVAQAQDFQPRDSADDTTTAEVTSFRDAVETLTQLANRFKALGLVDIQNQILRVMSLQTLNLLAILDAHLVEEDPYSSKEKTFGWWNGKGSLSQAAYDVRNSSELADYLAAQRDRVKVLEQQAEPLVAFQNAAAPARGGEQTRLVAKWQQIIADFHQYDGKKPGAAVTALEDFILVDLDKILPENSCQVSANPREGRENSNDYFLQIRANLRREVTARCLALGADTGYQTYIEISELFNKSLAGQFPFADVVAKAKTQPEATPESVIAFYGLFDKNLKGARSALKNNSLFGELSDKALHFLDEMEAIRPLVIPAAANAEKEPPFSLDFIPRFRVNNAREAGGNQIIDWTMQVGGQLFHQREPEHPGRWRAGNPVRLSLRWANDSLFQPVPDPAQPYMRIRERNAYFEFTNKWALLSFIRGLEAPPSDASSGSDSKPYLLKLKVKTARDPKWSRNDSEAATGEATVYLQIRIMLVGDKNPMVLPPFPIIAPNLEKPTAQQSAR
jgi:type VI secretion system protein ImpL